MTTRRVSELDAKAWWLQQHVLESKHLSLSLSPRNTLHRAYMSCSCSCSCAFRSSVELPSRGPGSCLLEVCTKLLEVHSRLLPGDLLAVRVLRVALVRLRCRTRRRQ